MMIMMIKMCKVVSERDLTHIRQWKHGRDAEVEQYYSSLFFLVTFYALGVSVFAIVMNIYYQMKIKKEK